MKKFFLLALLGSATHFTMAQDLDEIRNLTLLGQTEKAKGLIDKYMAVEKNAKKPEGWYYKGYIYNQASKDSTKTIDESSAIKSTAFDFLRKYREMDKKAELLTEQNNGPLFDLYVGFSSDLAIRAYNAKNLAGAYENFKKGVDVHDYIYANNLSGANDFKFSAIDTTLVLYTAIAAQELKKEDEAVTWFRKLIDADISGEGYIDAYQIAADYYKRKKDHAAFTDILAKARKLYPKNEEYWMALEIEEATDGAVKPGIFAKYEELMAKHPENYTVAYNYAVELYHYIYSDEMKGANTSEYKTKLVNAGKKSLAAKSTMEANFLMANFLYNNSIDLSDEARKIKGAKPEDVKKRKALEADATAQLNEAIPYAEAAVSIFEAKTDKPKSAEKINYKQSLTILKNIYDVKKDAAKMAAYDKKVQAAE